MQKIRSIHRIIIAGILLIAVQLTAACSRMGNAIDPGDWGYDCIVIYDALGGTINSREIRETYYMKNSYLFEPSGTTNLLIQPVKDGYILAGWYTSKIDIINNEGRLIGHSFKAEDRWDFDEDRIQEDMTVYARWIPQGKVDYVDADTGDTMFAKNITGDSPVQKLSSAAESLVAKDGFTLYGYYSDKECTVPYVFSDYIYTELIPSDEAIFAQLYEEFPEYISKMNYVEPSENEEESREEDTSDSYINKIGYEIVTDDETVRRQIRSRKDEIIENSITDYEKNSSKKTVYLKYIEGKYIRADHADDFRSSGKYGFTGLDLSGNLSDGYILLNDIDFDGVSVEMTESFSGKIYGNGYRIKNIEMNISSRKLDKDTSKEAGVFRNLEDAYMENVVFENLSINLEVKPGIPVTAGALAVNANNTTLKDVLFDTLRISTGRGDDGTAKYIIYDLFAGGEGNELNNVTGINVEISASEFAHVNSLFPPEEQETTEFVD